LPGNPDHGVVGPKLRAVVFTDLRGEEAEMVWLIDKLS